MLPNCKVFRAFVKFAVHYQDEMLVSVSLFVNVWYYA